MAIAEHLQRDGGLAATGFADQAEHLALLQGEAHVIDRTRPATTLPIGDAQVPHFEDRFLAHWFPSRTVRPRIRARPSVKRLSPTTSEAKARPGPSTVTGVMMMSARFSLIISPHSGVG